MFPLIPALILLLLHGPSSFERLTGTARMSEPVQTQQRGHATTPNRVEVGREQTSRRILAGLIAASGDRNLSEAFRAMFAGFGARDRSIPSVEEVEATSACPERPCERPTLDAGYARAQRTRDGPVRFEI